MSVSRPQGFTFPQRTSATAFPPSLPAWDISSRASVLNRSVKETSITPPTFSTTTTFFPCVWKRLENDQPYRKKAYEQLATVEAGAFAAAVMIGWQDSPIDIGCYYTTGPDAVGWGLIERSKRELTDSYWCFKAYGDLMRYPDRVKAEAQEPLYALAGRDGNGKTGVLVSGFRNGSGNIAVRLDHEPKNVSLKAVD